MYSLFPASLLFVGLTLVGSVLVVSGANWGMAWVGLELNLFSFVPLMVLSKGGTSAEGAAKYFIAQVSGSAIFLMGPILSNSSEVLSVAAMGMGLLIKLGSAPTHYWFPAVMASVSWFISFMLMTWQKLAPLWLCSHLIGFEGSAFIFSIAAGNAVLGALGGLSQTQLRPLLGYSSINHLGWMVALMAVGDWSVLLYWGVYSVLVAPVVLILESERVFSLKMLSALVEMSSAMAILFGGLMLSMAGMPPFGGFFLKSYVLSLLVDGGFWAVGMVLVISSVVALVYYLNLMMLSVVTGVGSSRLSRKVRFYSSISMGGVVSFMGVPLFVGSCLL